MVVGADSSNFDDCVRSFPVCVVFMHAAWCGSCRSAEPMVDDLFNGAYADRVRAVSVDIGESPEIGERYHVATLPYWLAFRDGELVDERHGAMMRRDVERMVNAIL